jgi:small ligand-binding sensory domain FIST
VFPYAHATGEDWQTLCDQLAVRLGTPPPGSELGFVYASERLAGSLGALVSCLRIKTGVNHWVGTVGLGVCSTGREAYDEPSVAAMVTDLPAERFRMIPGTARDFAPFLDATRTWRERNLAYFAVVHGDPSNARTPALIESLATALEGGYLVGGLTSSEGEQVQIADTPCSGGLSGVLLAGDVKVATGLTQGCTVLGRRHSVTSCRRNVVAEIDARPALEVLREELGGVSLETLSAMGGQVFVALPVRGSDTGDYLVRNLVGIDPDRGLLAVGDLVEIGQPIQFARRDRESAREDLRRMLRDVRGRLPGAPKGALYHTCLGRGRHLFGDDSDELRLIRETLGEVPLVGFYANGEISHHRLYGYTGVLTVFC